MALPAAGSISSSDVAKLFQGDILQLISHRSIFAHYERVATINDVTTSWCNPFRYWVLMELLRGWVSEFEPVIVQSQFDGEVVGLATMENPGEVVRFARALPQYDAKRRELRGFFRLKRPRFIEKEPVKGDEDAPQK